MFGDFSRVLKWKDTVIIPTVGSYGGQGLFIIAPPPEIMR
jgi:hypothetical protein